MTTEISAIATYLLGALATSRGVIEPMADRLVLVAGLGVVIDVPAVVEAAGSTASRSGSRATTSSRR